MLIKVRFFRSEGGKSDATMLELQVVIQQRLQFQKLL